MSHLENLAPIYQLLLIFKVHLKFIIISLKQQSSYFFLKSTVDDRTQYKEILSFTSLYYSQLNHWGLICGKAQCRNTANIWVFFLLCFCKNFIGLWMIYNIVLFSAVQLSDSVIHISIIFSDCFPI